MEFRDCVDNLRLNAEQCLRLAEQAADADAAEALRQMARDIEMALPILEEESARRMPLSSAR